MLFKGSSGDSGGFGLWHWAIHAAIRVSPSLGRPYKQLRVLDKRLLKSVSRAGLFHSTRKGWNCVPSGCVIFFKQVESKMSLCKLTLVANISSPKITNFWTIHALSFYPLRHFLCWSSGVGGTCLCKERGRSTRKHLLAPATVRVRQCQGMYLGNRIHNWDHELM